MLIKRSEKYFHVKLDNTVKFLNTKKKILFLTASNRWKGEKDKPKSHLLAEKIAEKISGDKVTIIDVSRLKIYNCEGNVSTSKGNNCGVPEANLNDRKKNPSNCHRCWASINNKDDELWKISRELLLSDCVVFFGSVRWGQMNAYYQKLIERLTWIENRHNTLNDKNIVEDIDAGLIIVGQNWNGKVVLETQKKVIGYFGFNVINDLCWNWQYTDDPKDESQKSYQNSFVKFKQLFLR